LTIEVVSPSKLVIVVSSENFGLKLDKGLDRRTMRLKAVELKLQLRSVIVEVGLQYQGLVPPVVLITTSSGDSPSEPLKVFLVQCLSALAETL
jgi:hypothetical protein